MQTVECRYTTTGRRTHEANTGKMREGDAHTRRYKTIWQRAKEGAGAVYKQEQQEAGKWAETR